MSELLLNFYNFIDYFKNCFGAYFVNPSFLGIGLAIIFGAIWLACFWPSLFKKPWHWAIMVGSALITPIIICLIQNPIRKLVGETMLKLYGSEALNSWLPFSAIPNMLIIGFAQEGAKLIPVIIYWWLKSKKIDYRLGLTLGAVAGAGFGIIEAQWIHNTVISMGWSWDLTQTKGLEALTPFTERFFMIAFSTAASALAGYGLAIGKGWQFYLIVSILDAVINSGTVLMQSKIFSFAQVEVFIAVGAILVTGTVLWLRWRKQTG